MGGYVGVDSMNKSVGRVYWRWIIPYDISIDHAPINNFDFQDHQLLTDRRDEAALVTAPAWQHP